MVTTAFDLWWEKWSMAKEEEVEGKKNFWNPNGMSIFLNDKIPFAQWNCAETFMCAHWNPKIPTDATVCINFLPGCCKTRLPIQMFIVDLSSNSPIPKRRNKLNGTHNNNNYHTYAQHIFDWHLLLLLLSHRLTVSW